MQLSKYAINDKGIKCFQLNLATYIDFYTEVSFSTTNKNKKQAFQE